MYVLPPVVRLGLLALATYRATYMIFAEDGPFDSLQTMRDYIYSNFTADHWVQRGFNCKFCMSFWVALFFCMAPTWVVEWFATAEVVRRLFEGE